MNRAGAALAFLQWPISALAAFFSLRVAQPELHRVIAVVLRRLLLQHGAGTRFDDGDADEIAVRVEQLRHAKFFAE